MSKISPVVKTFHQGEISRDLQGRTDSQIYGAAVERMENFIPTPQGPARLRPNTKHLNSTVFDEIYSNIVIPFNPINGDGYALVWERGFLQAYNTNGRVEDIIYAAEKENTGTAYNYYDGSVFVFTFESFHGRVVGEYIEAEIELTDDLTSDVTTEIVRGRITDIDGGFTPKWFEVSDSSIIPAANSRFTFLKEPRKLGGVELLVNDRIYDPTLFNWAQIGNEIYIVHPLYENVYKIIYNPVGSEHARFSGSNFEVVVNNRTWAPDETVGYFTSVTFYEQRLILGKGNEIYFSKVNDFDDFDLGTNANDPMSYRIAGSKNNASSIQWIQATEKYLLVGTSTGNYVVSGSSEFSPITPNSISIKPIDIHGANKIQAIHADARLYFVDRTNKTVRALEYSYQVRGYNSLDVNKLSKDISHPSIKNLAYAQGSPDMIIAVMDNGEAAGMVTDKAEGINSWFRIGLGNNDKFIDAGVIYNQELGDTIFFVVERYDSDGNPTRHVEYLEQNKPYPLREDFFISGVESTDDDLYLAQIREKQELDLRLDSKVFFDPSVKFISYDNVSNTLITDKRDLVIGDKIFEIDGPGELTITGGNFGAYDITIETEFTTPVMGADLTYVLRNTFNFSRFKGRKILVGCEFDLNEYVIPSNGILDITTLNSNKDSVVSSVTMGLPYKGLIKTLPLQGYTPLGETNFKRKNISNILFKVENTLGLKFGTDPYDLQEIEFRKDSDSIFDQVPLYSGITELDQVDDNSEIEKSLYFVQEKPYACTLISYGFYIDTEEI